MILRYFQWQVCSNAHSEPEREGVFNGLVHALLGNIASLTDDSQHRDHLISAWRNRRNTFVDWNPPVWRLRRAGPLSLLRADRNSRSNRFGVSANVHKDTGALRILSSMNATELQIDEVPCSYWRMPWWDGIVSLRHNFRAFYLRISPCWRTDSSSPKYTVIAFSLELGPGT